jgi:hypothetical protein
MEHSLHPSSLLASLHGTKCVSVPPHILPSMACTHCCHIHSAQCTCCHPAPAAPTLGTAPATSHPPFVCYCTPYISHTFPLIAIHRTPCTCTDPCTCTHRRSLDLHWPVLICPCTHSVLYAHTHTLPCGHRVPSTCTLSYIALLAPHFPPNHQEIALWLSTANKSDPWRKTMAAKKMSIKIKCVSGPFAPNI